MTASRETLVVASVSVLSGAEAQRLADVLVLSPMPAAALIAPVDVPPDIASKIRTFAESQELGGRDRLLRSGRPVLSAR
ncbi:hypothetical protein [Kribbella italica]|uniref:Uncharacterized protein n=1 Tax=Kribbella italica TaxID=1540520 RepID=A0A7W9JEE6_9ACTN|nr:hypothetical protein [Kribbella italica]MBB5840622.1 hypothetical protein [Kribbella italica]